jgi:hypothetical protein
LVTQAAAAAVLALVLVAGLHLVVVAQDQQILALWELPELVTQAVVVVVRKGKLQEMAVLVSLSLVTIQFILTSVI